MHYKLTASQFEFLRDLIQSTIDVYTLDARTKQYSDSCDFFIDQFSRSDLTSLKLLLQAFSDCDQITFCK